MLSFVDEDIHHEKFKLSKTGKMGSEIQFAERRLTWRIICRKWRYDRESPVMSCDVLAPSDMFCQSS
ncbi:hypothetical protein T03_14308 [Trichinella britovi]|uniref:Uncharacterized protein n=1 Tax=Trichinella britovi TaxID=45882 RepID=A0A0V1DHE5_TRIBR|nr:hypothetical protein T03_14308 [Trichinella britovi]